MRLLVHRSVVELLPAIRGFVEVITDVLDFIKVNPVLKLSLVITVERSCQRLTLQT